MPFKPASELPNPLPPGAHRVISSMTAAQMRKMMEGVVLYGTGKPAQLNGYSSGGKTGTAQKVDPVTHLYSKTMHIASFAGIAPVNNPVIAVAVVIDTPKGASYYGAAVSAPVFAEVAQQVLEYLGVPHDIEFRAAQARLPSPTKPVAEDDHETTPATSTPSSRRSTICPPTIRCAIPPPQPAAPPPAPSATEPKPSTSPAANGRLRGTASAQSSRCLSRRRYGGGR